MTINFEAIGAKQAADDMVDAVNAIHVTINKVTEAIGHSKGGWGGDAADACGVAASSWEDESHRLKSILNDITTEVGEGNRGYQSMEADNKDFFTNLH
ncbi:WXG100 family type VII secretion target [Nocardia sp. NBC_01388]|uniref:WXG100 family type VII secretion target n=1 Tax=Nocardia sp. NBC_01388 TaxID=2903596 RepID=UPI00324B7461